MISFAVWHEGIEEGTGRWVLAIGDGSLLLSDSEGKLYWQPMAECRTVRFHTPEQPSLVIPVQPQQQNGLALPELNRQMRRNGLHLN